MLLGGTVAGLYTDPEEWERALAASGFRAVTAPFSCDTPRDEIRAYCKAASRHRVKIAEIGVWRNLLDPDAEKAKEAMNYAKRQLALADEKGIPCCVNIAGTPGTAGWDAADPANFTEEVYQQTVGCIREILDDVKPGRAFYCIEPMPWMVPDSPDAYVQLIRDVDRDRFAAHMDFVNMINCPRRYLAPESFIEECFRKLGPYIKSTHIKDTRMDPMRLTTVIEECSPGEGRLHYAEILRIMDRYLPADAPVLLEHMQTPEEYRTAYDYVAGKAAEAGIDIQGGEG